MGDFISTMYFPIMRTKIDEELISNEEAIMKKANLNLSLRDRLDDLIWLAPFLCCCKGRNKKMY